MCKAEQTANPSSCHPVVLCAQIAKETAVTMLDEARRSKSRPSHPGAAEVIGDMVGTVGLVLCVPIAILAIGAPIALCLRLGLWLAGML